MNGHGLTEKELELICDVFACHETISSAVLFGSRAKGTAAPESDIDVALYGVTEPLEAQAIAAELEALPLPYRFDVLAYACIKHPPLVEHINRVGIEIYHRSSE